MVVYDFDVDGFTINPTKANPPLIVDANTILAVPIAAQALKAVSGTSADLIERRGGVERIEPLLCLAPERIELTDTLPAMNSFSVTVFELHHFPCATRNTGGPC